MLTNSQDTNRIQMPNSTESNTAKIVEEFVKQVDTSINYSSKELKDIIGQIHKTFNATSKKNSSTNKEKRAPTKYNMFVKNKIKEIREEDTTLTAKEAMGKAATMWGQMSKEEKENYSEE